MVVCPFFLRGICKFGTACRNEHPVNPQSSGGTGGSETASAFKSFTVDSINSDVTPIKGKPFWPLSCYGCGMYEPTMIVGIDQSMEELRVMAVKAKTSGNMDEYVKYEADEIAAAEKMYANVRHNPFQFYMEAKQASNRAAAAFATAPSQESLVNSTATRASAFGCTSNAGSSAFGNPSKATLTPELANMLGQTQQASSPLRVSSVPAKRLPPAFRASAPQEGALTDPQAPEGGTFSKASNRPPVHMITTEETPLGKIAGGGPVCAEIVKKDPMEQVLASDDILPLILSRLKDLFDSEKSSWKGFFYSLLFVNHSFSRFASRILWKKMESMTPLLKLLPWFKSDYQGLGTYKYSGANDWRSFSQYAAHIQHFTFRSSGAIPIHPIWVFELLALQGRPSNPFRALKYISICEGAYSGLPILALLVGSPLRGLEITTCQHHIHFAPVPPDWTYCTDTTLAKRVQQNMLALLPTISFTAVNLTSFHYRGPVSEDLLHRTSTLRSLRTLRLTIANSVDVKYFLPLCGFPSLRELIIAAPLLKPEDSRLKGAHGPRNFPNLIHMNVYAPGKLQEPIRQVLFAEGLHHLDLEFIQATGPNDFCSTVVRYFNRNPELQSVAITFSSCSAGLSPESFSIWVEADVQHECRQVVGLEKITFLNIPPDIQGPASTLLINSMPYWKRLRTLRFRITPGTPSSNIPPVAFPGLSFLHSTVVKECLSLETLEFHFDEGKITQDDLTPFLSRHPPSSKLGASLSDPHPLRDLTINTIVACAKD